MYLIDQTIPQTCGSYHADPTYVTLTATCAAVLFSTYLANQKAFKMLLDKPAGGRSAKAGSKALRAI
jgi:hypothetical protein